MHQVEMVSLDSLVPDNHIYREFMAIWSFAGVEKKLKKFEKDNAYKGFGMLRLFKYLLLQFMEDNSDREMQRFLQENNAGKWFCGFGLAIHVYNQVRTKNQLCSVIHVFLLPLKSHRVISQQYLNLKLKRLVTIHEIEKC